MLDRIEQPQTADDPIRPSTSPWRRRASTLALVLCIFYALGAIGLWLFLRLEGDSWWPATFLLFSPRWIWIVPLLLVLPLTILFRRRWAWLAAATGFFVLFQLMGFCIPWRTAFAHASGKGTVRIVTANLHGREVDAAVLNDFLSRTHPDVVVLQEFEPGTVLPYVEQPGWHQEYAGQMLIASRWPLGPGKVLNLKELPETPVERSRHINVWGIATRWIVYSPAEIAGTFQLDGVHLISPHAALSLTRKDRDQAEMLLDDNATRREHELNVLRQHVDEVPGPTIILGDFNTTDDSPIFRENFADYSDAFTTAGLGFGASYAKHRTWIRIDHILFDPTWTCRRCYTSGDVGSGHRAVLAELSR